MNYLSIEQQVSITRSAIPWLRTSLLRRLSCWAIFAPGLIGPMCGIFLGIGEGGYLAPDSLDFLKSRGPDQISDKCVEINGKIIRIISSVLHIRGEEIQAQPIEGERYILQWNGEIYDGLQVIMYYTFLNKFIF